MYPLVRNNPVLLFQLLPHSPNPPPPPGQSGMFFSTIRNDPISQGWVLITSHLPTDVPNITASYLSDQLRFWRLSLPIYLSSPLSHWNMEAIDPEKKLNICAVGGGETPWKKGAREWKALLRAVCGAHMALTVSARAGPTYSRWSSLYRQTWGMKWQGQGLSAFSMCEISLVAQSNVSTGGKHLPLPKPGWPHWLQKGGPEQPVRSRYSSSAFYLPEYKLLKREAYLHRHSCQPHLPSCV